MLNKRTLGRSKLEVSEIAFGGVEIGIPYGIGIDSEDKMLSDNKAIELLGEAVNQGVNFFDTARSYGKSETLMGKAFQNCRDHVVISSKCVHLGSILKENSPGKTAQTIEDSFSQSLAELKTDYIDLYMLHDGTVDVMQSPEVQGAFLRLKEQGLVKAIGSSTYTVEETRFAIDSGIWDVIQLPFNLMDQRHGMLFARAKQNGVGIVVRSVLFKGILTDRGRELHPELSKVTEHRKKYERLLKGTQTSLSDFASKFVLSFEEVGSVLVGIDRKEYLDKAVAAANGDYLNQQQREHAESLAYPEPDFLNLPYWNRMGWLT